MQLSHSVVTDSTNQAGILQRATFLTFGDASNHTTSYPLVDMVTSANRWVTKTGTQIWRASRTWEFDDKNQTDLPIATTTLVAGQQDYALQTTTLKINRVEVLDSSGDYQKLSQIDQSEVPMALSEFYETDGMPVWYDILGNSLFLYPAPAAGSVTTALGLKIYFTREMTTFSVPSSYTVEDTTQPGFDEDFHDIICYGIAQDWLRANGEKAKADDYFGVINQMFIDIAQRYGQKSPDKKVAVAPRRERYF